MSKSNDNDVCRSEGTLTPDQISLLVEAVENVIGDCGRGDILCVLMKATLNAIHVWEEPEERRYIEDEYIKALRALSAVEEHFQGEAETAVISEGKKMLVHLSRAMTAAF